MGFKVKVVCVFASLCVASACMCAYVHVHCCMLLQCQAILSVCISVAKNSLL